MNDDVFDIIVVPVDIFFIIELFKERNKIQPKFYYNNNETQIWKNMGRKYEYESSNRNNRWKSIFLFIILYDLVVFGWDVFCYKACV